jgi:hypothetical protein
MSIFTTLFSATAGKVINAAGALVDRFVQSPDEAAKMKLAFAQLIEARDSELETTIRVEMDAKARVLEAELRQGDTFTKRARPSVVYGGLLLVFLNHVVLPWIAHFTSGAPPSIEIPAMFWTAWGGICATWVIGRTAEKRGAGNRLTSLITGS